MYRGFNCEFDAYGEEYYQLGLPKYDNQKTQIKDNLDKYLSKDGSLDGSIMQEDWFPEIKADIFISHSHKDIKAAISLAGLISEYLKLEVFVDSCIWGNSNELLKIIDNKYCFDKQLKIYKYNLRNQSTSHVHMMLSTALQMMIDKTECLLFLNTPDSISSTDIINKTESPWIYYELATAKTIRKQIPERLKLMNLNESFSGADGKIEKSFPSIKYTVDLGHLKKLTDDGFIKWVEQSMERNQNALDILYELNPIKNAN